MEAMLAPLSATYSREMAARKLCSNAPILQELVAEGIVPFVPDGNTIRFDQDYIDGLAELLEVSGLGRRVSRIDRTLIQLYYLKHQFSLCNVRPPNREDRRRAAAIRQQCAELLWSGQAITLDTLCEELRDYASLHTVQRWSATGRIATVRIGMKIYTSRWTANRLAWYFGKCEPFTVAADRHGLSSARTINYWSRIGKVSAVTGPDGMARLAPGTELPIRHVAGTVSITDAANELGVTPDCLSKNAARGYIRSVWVRNIRRIPEGELAFWKERFNQLNPGFDWLQELAGLSSRPLAVVTSKQAGRILSMANDSPLGVWKHRALLPYYVRSFAGGLEVCWYVRPYVEGLRRFVPGDRAVRRSQAAAYRALCAEHGNIV